MKEEIVSWLKSGCNLGKGVALYLQYGDNARFKKMLYLDPGKNFLKLKLLLCRLAGLEETNYSGAIREMERDRFREMYSFLSDRDCPNELKILAADKITTYWRIVELHEKIFRCGSVEDCLAVSFELVNTFIEDYRIKQELDYYKNHHGVLGKHRIFESQSRVDKMRKMSVKELIRKEKQLRDNIWRIKSEIAKGDKPYLLHDREQRLKEREKELELVTRMLDE